MAKSAKFIGLDIHKETISIDRADAGRSGEIRYYCSINNTVQSLDRFINKMDRKRYQMYFVYDAGPCGYVIYRHFKSKVEFLFNSVIPCKGRRASYPRRPEVKP